MEAEKTNVFGRANGGIITLFKKFLDFKTVKKSNKWIISEMKHIEGNIIIGNVYCKPDLITSETMEELCQDINSSLDNMEFPDLVVGGDFNGRVGESSYLEEEIIEVSDCIKEVRVSKDKISNSRGKAVLLAMEELGLTLLNGRVDGDIPGEFTHVSERGNSVIDLVYSNLTCIPKVQRLKVEYDITSSDHFPLSLELNLTVNEDNIEINEDNNVITTYKLKWKDDMKQSYQESFKYALQQKLEEVNKEDSTDLSHLLKTIIKEIACKEGMMEKFK